MKIWFTMLDETHHSSVRFFTDQSFSLRCGIRKRKTLRAKTHRAFLSGGEAGI